jgi:crotonobetaine/carnitine-CoA ligase
MAVVWEDSAPNDRISPMYWEGYSVRELTIGNILAHQARERGDAVYLHDLATDRRYTYRDVDALTNRLANGLLAQGIRQHERVAVMLDSSADCLFLHFALGKIGAVSVPITTSQRGVSLAHIFTSAEVVAVVTEAACSAEVMARAAESSLVRLVVTRGALADGLPASPARIDFSQLAQGGEDRPDIAVRFNDPAFIMFTSGTTGPAKGNVFLQATALMWEQAAPRIWGFSAEDTYYFCVSMAHAAGLFGIAYIMAAVGGRVALAQRFSASAFLDDVRRSGATIAMLLGAMANFVESTPASADDRANPLRLLLAGPMPRDPEAMMRRFDVMLAQGYGLTDHSSFAKVPLGAPTDKLRAAGKIVEPFEVQIVDEEDFPLPAGEVGEILVRSRYPWRATSGYFRRPADSMAARTNDWFHTGDRGMFAEDGYLYFVDRKKDAIRRRGENISAFEVERVVLTHPAVAEAAAYAVASALSEEEVCVSIVPHAGATIDPPELIRFCIGLMPGYMVPRFLHLADELPKTLTQRVEKYKLRQAAAAHPEILWDRETLDEFKRIR